MDRITGIGGAALAVISTVGFYALAIVGAIGALYAALHVIRPTRAILLMIKQIQEPTVKIVLIVLSVGMLLSIPAIALGLYYATIYTKVKIRQAT